MRSENARDDIRQADGISTLAAILRYSRNERVINLASLALVNLSVSGTQPINPKLITLDANAEQMLSNAIVELLLSNVSQFSAATQVNILHALANLVDYSKFSFN